MSKKSSEDLDKLFQQEPEQYPHGYNEASWQEMEKLLDKDDRSRFLWWWFFGIGALLLIGSIFFFGKNETEVVDVNLGVDKKEIVENQNQNSNQNLNSNLESESESSSEILPSKDSKENDELRSNLASIKKESSTSKQSNTSATKKSEQDINKKQKEDPSLIFDDVEFRGSQIGNIVSPDSILEKPNNLGNDFLLEKPNPEVEEKDSVNTLLQTIPIFPIASLNLFLSEKSELYGIPLLKEKIEGVPVGNKNILLIGLVLGGESTATNRDDFSQPNWKIGGQLEYRFLERFSASVGANFVRKKYGARGSDYKPDPDSGSWLYDIAPTTVEASCDILELPVSIGFFQKKNNQNGFYSKLGLMSFFMLEEHYYYFYDQEIPGQIKYYGGVNENRHWFGVGEVSVGYQYYLTPRTSVQLEPFLQIPLTGVGNGNVKLWSVGLNMKFNFQVNNRLLKSPLKK